MSFSIKKLFLISLIIGPITFSSFFFIQELKAGCNVQCWVKRTCTEPHEGTSSCTPWSDPYDCSLNCSAAAPDDHGGSGNAGDTNTPKGGPISGPGTSGGSNATSVSATIDNQCNLIIPSPNSPLKQRECTFPEYNPNYDIHGPDPVTRHTVLNFLISSSLPSVIQEGCRRAFNDIDNYGNERESNISWKWNQDENFFVPHDGSLSFIDHLPSGSSEEVVGNNETKPPSFFRRRGSSKILFSKSAFETQIGAFGSGALDDYNKGGVDALSPARKAALTDYYQDVCTHEIEHGHGWKDLYKNENGDDHSESTMGRPGWATDYLSNPKERKGYDYCLRAADAYKEKYGADAYTKDLPCRGSKGTIANFLDRLNKALKK